MSLSVWPIRWMTWLMDCKACVVSCPMRLSSPPTRRPMPPSTCVTPVAMARRMAAKVPPVSRLNSRTMPWLLCRASCRICRSASKRAPSLGSGSAGGALPAFSELSELRGASASASASCALRRLSCRACTAVRRTRPIQCVASAPTRPIAGMTMPCMTRLSMAAMADITELSACVSSRRLLVMAALAVASSAPSVAEQVFSSPSSKPNPALAICPSSASVPPSAWLTRLAALLSMPVARLRKVATPGRSGREKLLRNPVMRPAMPLTRSCRLSDRLPRLACTRKRASSALSCAACSAPVTAPASQLRAPTAAL